MTMFVHIILCPQTKDCPAFNTPSITDLQELPSSLILTFHSHINITFRLHDVLLSNMVSFRYLVLYSFSYFLVSICLVPVCPIPLIFLQQSMSPLYTSMD